MQLYEFSDVLNQPYEVYLSEEKSFPLHWHYYSEILYIKKGSIRITCNEQEYILQEGDLCYFYPLQLHEIAATDELPVEYTVVKFDFHTLTLPPAHQAKLYDYFIHRTHSDDFCILIRHEALNTTPMHTYMDHIFFTYQTKDEFFSLQMQADIYSILIEIAKKSNKTIGTVNRRRNDTDFTFHHILEYIDTHSGESLEIQELAEMCHMSYSHFAKLFRENYGRSCKEYITYIRLVKAQDYLLHTDYDINYIALETGFFDCSHFIRTYKKWKGITPKQERMYKSI
ncbi:MAG: helix-turn-helix domain-containing protein [Lachnospiraceae bacterium]|nr:helix-turn-helix domain-containing protein [Lachnospiraceae bacterium]